MLFLSNLKLKLGISYSRTTCWLATLIVMLLLGPQFVVSADPIPLYHNGKSACNTDNCLRAKLLIYESIDCWDDHEAVDLCGPFNSHPWPDNLYYLSHSNGYRDRHSPRQHLS